MIKNLKGQKGFTLIELMIVIAIIGILAAIAIPNFISYRDKAYCSAAEADAGSISAALANYFSDPTKITGPASSADLGIILSGKGANINTDAITYAANNGPITIKVTDKSVRCPKVTGTPKVYTTTMGSTSGVWGNS